MSQQLKIIILNLLIVSALIPIIVSGNFALKFLAGFYGIWLVYKRSWNYIPALILLISFLSNAYFIYLSILFLGIQNFSSLRFKGYSLVFIPSAFLALFALGDSIYAVWEGKGSFGPNFAKYEIVVSILSMTYGVLLKDKLNKTVATGLILSFLLVLFLQWLEIVVFIRLMFYILPFAIGYALFSYLELKRFKVKKFFLSLIFLVYVYITYTPTFTIILSGVLASFLFYLYSKKRFGLLKGFIGSPALVILTAITFYAITSYSTNSFYEYRNLKMNDVENVSDFYNRGRMKLFEDRAPLWAGALRQIVLNPSILPPTVIKEIEIDQRGEKNKRKWEFHAHNVYLELIRTTGILIGGFTIITLVLGVIKTKNTVIKYSITQEEALFFSISIGVILIGSFTGIFVLSRDFSLLPLTIMGYTYSLKYSCLIK